MEETKSYKEYLEQITTLVFDVDGVFTDNKIHLLPDGSLTRVFNVKDGYALLRALEVGMNICIITGGSDPMVKQQFEKLGVTDVYLNTSAKTQRLKTYLDTHNIQHKNVLYMGDDIPDLYPMQTVGLACCPQDAVQEVKKVAQYISHKKGGEGCVREVVEQVLKIKGKWFS